MSSKLSVRFGNYIRSSRRQGIYVTQRELGAHCGISMCHVARVENAQRCASLDVAKTLADGLGVPLWKIIKEIEQ